MQCRPLVLLTLGVSSWLGGCQSREVRISQGLAGHDVKIVRVREIEKVDLNVRANDDGYMYLGIGVSVASATPGCIDLGSSLLATAEGKALDLLAIAELPKADTMTNKTPTKFSRGPLERVEVVGNEGVTIYSIDHDRLNFRPGTLTIKVPREVRIELLYSVPRKSKSFQLALSDRGCPKS